MKTWLDKWEPEDEGFWKNTGSKIAWKTLTITTLSLILSFASWFMMSVIAVKLPGLGFPFSKDTIRVIFIYPGFINHKPITATSLSGKAWRTRSACGKPCETQPGHSI